LVKVKKISTEQRQKRRLYQRKYQGKHRKVVRLKILNYLGGKCIKCGYNDNPDGLQIDHKRPKRLRGTHGYRGNDTFQYGSWAWANISWHKVLIELKKCQLLCGTCHSIKTRMELRESKGWTIK